MNSDEKPRERQAADPDFERLLRELSQVTWKYHEWWHRYNDEIEALIDVQFGRDAAQKVAEYRKARSAVTTAMTSLAGLVNEAVEKEI